MTGLVDAAQEIRDKGSFNYLDDLMPSSTLNGFMQG